MGNVGAYWSCILTQIRATDFPVVIVCVLVQRSFEEAERCITLFWLGRSQGNIYQFVETSLKA